MDKLERLLTLTATLLDARRPMTAEELREKVPGYPENLAAFRRAFERDKEDLREMGIPLSVQTVEDLERPIEGYQILRADYELPDPGLDADELSALNLAAAMVSLGDGEGAEGLWKLGGVVADAGSRTSLAALPTEPALLPTFGAVVDRRPMSFTYRNPRAPGAPEVGARRDLEPHRLDYQGGRWYVTGLDRNVGEIRMFRLDRIEEGSVEVGAPGVFDSPAPSGPALAPPWELGGGEQVTARLLVDASHAPWTQRHLDAEPSETRDDGSMVFDVAVTNWPAFRSFVLTFLDHAELLDPPDLRADLVAWLAQIADPVRATVPGDGEVGSSWQG